MKRSLWAAVLVAMALVIAACGGETNGGGGGDDTATGGDADTGAADTEATGDGGGDPITLTIWTFGAMGLDDLIAQYEEDHPNITVETQISGYDEHHEALLTALASGQGPDIAAIEVAFSAAFRDVASAFYDLRDFGADEIEGDYLDWRWQQGVAPDGQVFGIPTDVGGLAMAYRVDLFEEAGLPTDRDEVSALWEDSWDDFISVGEQFTEATGLPFIDSASGSIFVPMTNQVSERYYNEQGEPIYDTNPQVEEAWDTAMRAVEAGISGNIAQFSPEWNTGMAEGDFAVLAAPAWMTGGYIQEQAPDTEDLWDLAVVPGLDGNWGGSQMAIPSSSPHAEEAYALISWLLAPEQQLTVFEEIGNFPSAPELYETDEVQSMTYPFFNDAPAGEIYIRSVQDKAPLYEGPRERQIQIEMQDAIGRVEDGTESPDEAWSSAMANVAREVSG